MSLEQLQKLIQYYSCLSEARNLAAGFAGAYTNEVSLYGLRAEQCSGPSPLLPPYPGGGIGWVEFAITITEDYIIYMVGGSVPWTRERGSTYRALHCIC